LSALDWVHPERLPWLLAGLLTAAIALGGALRRASSARARLLERGTRDQPRPGVASDALLFAALVALAIALLGPRLGTQTLRYPATGIDVVILLDVSRSMDALDNAPTRLARARRAAGAVLRHLRDGDRAALAVFAGHGALLTPLTPDAAALVELLSSVDRELLTDRGSDVGAGLEASLAAFDPDSARPRALLLLSDGEHAGRVPEEVVQRLTLAAVRVVTGALGSDEGAPVPTERGALRDARGREVVSERNPAALSAIATATGGESLLADSWGVFEPGALLAAVRRGALPGADGFVEREVRVARYRAPALIAFVLLAMEASGAGGWLRRRWSSRRARRGALAAAAALALGSAAGEAGFDSAEDWVRAQPESARALVAAGLERAENGSMREAERAFLAAAVRAREPEVGATAYYDLGVTLLERGSFESARDAFFDALALSPDDDRARFNLEWTLAAIDRRRPEGSSEDGENESDARPRAGDDRTEPPDLGEDHGDAPAQTDAAATRPDDPGSAAPLDAADASKWLDAVRDDPGRALRATAADGASGRTVRGPRW
jgi:Ca-activated chloride channel family protein